jgi:hypothetical protein
MFKIKSKGIWIAVVSSVFLLTLCKETQKHPAEESTVTVAELPVESDTIRPVPFPSGMGIQGFSFPEDSGKIYSWLSPYDSVSIAKHAWGLWAGLTAPSGEYYKGEELLVFETWEGLTDLSDEVKMGNESAGCDNIKVGRTKFSVPRQFFHAINSVNRLKGSIGIDTSGTILETVAYDPNAACFATKQLIFRESVLKGYYKEGQIGSIPQFPNNAITLKPTYFVARLADAVAGKNTDSLIRVPVWPGPPAKPKGFPSTAWNYYVYVDVTNKQPADKKIVPARGNNPAADSLQLATVNLNEFINVKIDSAAAAYINKEQGAGTVVAGDLALLMAMHVGTKEISNWTWQTFFWAPDPADPFFPSGKWAAALRPSQLKGAASNYAVSTAYAMVLPNQPISGGTNKNVKPVIGFNPYLEAGFTPDVFQLKNQLNANLKFGIQTNCMSCHALAMYKGTQPYSTDQYIDMSDKKIFTNTVKLDFAWSIMGGFIPDTSHSGK